MMKSVILDEQRIVTVQQEILWRYAVYGRDLPWRHTTDPYYILLSEVMSQQTQVSRVIEYYHRFIQRYPSIQDLAISSKAELLSMRSGLGYNSRALRLQQCCQAVVDQYAGVMPEQYESLIQLPGIGPYTANAILAFAYNQDTPVMDTNIRRVLIYSFKLPHDISPKLLVDTARQCVPHGHGRIWNNALMDYGAMVLTSSVTGIKSLSQQWSFEWSTRQVRSQVLQYILKTKKADLDQLRSLTTHIQFDLILQKMLKEGIVVKNGEMYEIGE